MSFSRFNISEVVCFAFASIHFHFHMIQWKYFPTPELLGAASLESLDTENIHKKYIAEYDQLKEEFERYKLRAQSVLKNKSTKVGHLHVHVVYLPVV